MRAGDKRRIVEHPIRGVMDTADRLPRTGAQGIYLKQQLRDTLIEQYMTQDGRDMPEVRDCTWGATSVGTLV